MSELNSKLWPCVSGKFGPHMNPSLVLESSCDERSARAGRDGTTKQPRWHPPKHMVDGADAPRRTRREAK